MNYNSRCQRCGSYAINHNSHGRDGSDGHLCDVCYWRSRAELDFHDADRFRTFANFAVEKNGDFARLLNDHPLAETCQSIDDVRHVFDCAISEMDKMTKPKKTRKAKK